MAGKVKMTDKTNKVNNAGRLQASKDRRQGFFTGVGVALVAIVMIAVVLIFLPQGTNNVKENSANIGEAAFEVSVSRKELNALVDKYLNSDATLKDKIRFEMTKNGMMVYGTYVLFGQNVDFGMKASPEVTKKGNLLLHADSVAVGQLPLPVKYVMSYLGGMVDLPSWLTINADKQTILIDFSKTPEVQGVRFKAVTVDPAKDKFVFRGGFEK
jgi:uncharacterized protein YpmS